LTNFQVVRFYLKFILLKFSKTLGHFRVNSKLTHTHTHTHKQKLKDCRAKTKLQQKQVSKSSGV